MKVRRTIKMKVQIFEIGDTFTFKMKDGEKVKVRAVQKDVNGNMLFIFEDCLKDKYTMNQIFNKGILKKIYKRLPKKIRKMLVAFNDGGYLRLPTEKEIFGENKYGKEESTNIKQFECMKQRKNRIVFHDFGTDEWEWYWLANRHKSSVGYFTTVSSDGNSCYTGASSSGGVRPIFCIKNL